MANINYEVESNDDELILTEDESDEILSNLKDELILESIMEQIDNPFNNTSKNTDYLELFNTRYSYLTSVYNNSTSFIDKLNVVRDNIYNEIFKRIVNKFNISYTDNGFDINETANSLYHFFCLDYRDNIIEYLINHIMKERKSLSANLSEPQYSKTLSANALKKVIKNRDIALILANINEVIKNLISRENDNLEVIKSICNYDIAEVTNFHINQYFLIDFSMSPNADFNQIYFGILLNKEEGYSSIINDVKTKIFNIAEKK